ncbi:carbohydrate esterase family 4 protein [Mycena vulgaris]|nr:carbohydrate esterase family 4 protein [Mycena vulgaris]
MRTTILLAAFAGITSALTISARDGTLANVYTSCIVPGQVALTFDDGPWKYIKSISDQLSAVGGNATFFVNGNNYACIYGDDQVAGLKYAFSKGHQIASHTWSHADLVTVDQATLDSEITKVDDALIRILGVQPAFLRPPYGSYNDIVRAAAAAHKKDLIIWDLDSGDSTGASPNASKIVYDKGKSSPTGNILALNHETVGTTATDVLPYVLQLLGTGPGGYGYTFVTVADCLGGLAPYTTVTTPGTANWMWHC